MKIIHIKEINCSVGTADQLYLVAVHVIHRFSPSKTAS